MEVSKVTTEDGKSCAVLMNLITHGKWEMSSKEMESLFETKKWLHGLALKMAAQLKSPPPENKQEFTPLNPPEVPLPASGFRIKSRGSLGGNKPQKSTKKKK